MTQIGQLLPEIVLHPTIFVGIRGQFDLQAEGRRMGQILSPLI